MPINAEEVRECTRKFIQLNHDAMMDGAREALARRFAGDQTVRNMSIRMDNGERTALVVTIEQHDGDEFVIRMPCRWRMP